MDKMKCTRKFFPLLLGSLFLASCGEQSNTTGWEYNESDNGGFFVNTDYGGQKTGPGLVFIEGGTFTMGETSEDFYKEWDNVPRRVAVQSFYIDENEVTNADYREYLYWLRRVYDIAYYPEILNSALPDTLVWRDELSYNEQMVRNYFRHPAYNFYPVVGVSWIQAMKYCSWRTDRVNEKILIERGILNEFPDQQGVDHFDTEKYLYKPGEYTQQNKKGLKSYKPNSPYGEEGRPARIEDGILLPRYRLPTEAEWEYAAYANNGQRIYNRITSRNEFTWNSNGLRNPDEDHRGELLANFKRGRGDYMGVGGWLNDKAAYTIQVKFYPPNDFGLYDMAGNVAEWVMDVYRPRSPQDVRGLNPFRGNQFKTFDRNYKDIGALEVLQEPQYDEDSNIVRLPGDLPIRPVTEEENLDRRNYKKSDYRDYIDGDKQSSVYYDESVPKDQEPMYDYAQTTLIGNTSRVYKGGSWKDNAYWLSPGVRRHLAEDQATDYIGFRCAMSRVGFQDRDGEREKRPDEPTRDRFERYEYN